MKLLLVVAIFIISLVLLYIVGDAFIAGETSVFTGKRRFDVDFSASPISFSVLMLFYSSFGVALMFLAVRMLPLALRLRSHQDVDSVIEKSDLLLKALELESQGKLEEALEIYKSIENEPNKRL